MEAGVSAGVSIGSSLGMPCSTYKATPAEKSRNEVRLKKMLVGENQKCAECKQSLEFRSAWASINLGVFTCIQCSGVHRSLGVDISKVRAVGADDWNDDWCANMERWGNQRAAGFWEARPPMHRPLSSAGGSASVGVVEFIKVRGIRHV
jgi:hypothetical protein